MIEDVEFKRMLWLSTGFHVTLIAGILMVQTVSKSHFFDTPSLQTQALDVMWATTVQSPPVTKENKLPAPIVPIETKQPEKSKAIAPKIVDSAKAKPISKRDEEEARRKAMMDAVAALRSQAEKRPTPRLDNFPSLKDAANATKGIPASPEGGGLGGIAGNPIFQAYRNQIREILSDNLIWVQQTRPQAEVTFQLDPSGNVMNLQISKSSGDPTYDNAALRAVRKSSPLPLPPPELQSQILKEEFTVSFQPRKL